jgi:hypothetical protein
VDQSQIGRKANILSSNTGIFRGVEWTQISLPKEEDLQARLAQPLALSDPQALVEKAEQLLQRNTWPEVVLLIGFNTGA